MPDEKQVIDDAASRSPTTSKLFKTAFPDDKEPITYDNTGQGDRRVRAQAWSRRRASTSSWSGDDKARSPPRRRPASTSFLDAGCATCHTGAPSAAPTFQKLGPDEGVRRASRTTGATTCTKDEKDKFFFTRPDPQQRRRRRGPTSTTARSRRWTEAGDQDGAGTSSAWRPKPRVKSIVTFLDTLTGEILEADYIKQPSNLPKGRSQPRRRPGPARRADLSLFSRVHLIAPGGASQLCSALSDEHGSGDGVRSALAPEDGRSASSEGARTRYSRRTSEGRIALRARALATARALAFPIAAPGVTDQLRRGTSSSSGSSSSASARMRGRAGGLRLSFPQGRGSSP